MDRHLALGTMPDLRDQTLPELTDRLVLGQGWNEYEERQMSVALKIAEILHADDTHRGKPYQNHLVRAGLRVVDVDYLGLHSAAAGTASVLHGTVKYRDSELIELYNSGSPLFGEAPRSRVLVPTDSRMRQAAAFGVIRLTFGNDVTRGIVGVTNPPMSFTRNTPEKKINDARLQVRREVITPARWAIKVADVTDHSTDEAEPGSETEKKLAYYNRINFATLDELRLRLLMDEQIQSSLTPRAIQYFYDHYNSAKKLVHPHQRDTVA